jgi:6-phosphogluconolactonase (cycloisomerase 2 family)
LSQTDIPEVAMRSAFKQVALTLITAAISACWMACGEGNPPHPCQGATCVPSAATFLYLTALDDVSGFAIAPSGTPTSLQSQAGPNQSIGVVADPGAKFLFVSDFENASVHVLSIGHSGALAPVARSPFPAGTPPDAGGIALDSAAKFLYVTLPNSGKVAGFSINASTGALTPIAGLPIPAGSNPGQAIVAPSGRFLYVSNLNDAQGSISAYSIDPGSGALTEISGSPFPTQANFPGPAGLAIGGSGKFLSIAMVGTANANHVVSGLSIDPTTGVLTQMATSPFPAGLGPIRLASDTAGKFLFVANSHDDTLSAFIIDAASGALTAVGLPYATGSAPVDVVVDPQGKFVFVANSGSSDLSAFSLDSSTGALTPLSGSPFASGQQEPGGLAIVRTQ